MIYAYKVENGIVVNGIVGNAAWAMEKLGGFWVESETLAWIGGIWDEVNGFQPPPAPIVTEVPE